jgi:hypothetical protein
VRRGVPVALAVVWCDRCGARRSHSLCAAAPTVGEPAAADHGDDVGHGGGSSSSAAVVRAYLTRWPRTHRAAYRVELLGMVPVSCHFGSACP